MMVLIALLLLLASVVYGKEYMPPMTGLSDDRVKRIAEAIATAEGWYGVGAANDVQRARNNPGNLMWFQAGIISSFPSEAEGWAALYSQINKMLAGLGGYSSDMTLEQVAQLYEGTGLYMNWAVNVARVLGVPTSTRLGDVA